jgi:hypothetical protein
MSTPDRTLPSAPHLRVIRVAQESSRDESGTPHEEAPEIFGTEFIPFPEAAPRTRPTPVIDLDGIPRARWRIEPGARYLWNGRMWIQEQVGCVLCVEDDAALTFSTVDDRSPVVVCTEHGELCEVPYEMRKVYTIRVGDIVREGEESIVDTMLFPTEMTLSQRNALIERLLDEAQADEAEAGAVPSGDE